MVSPTALIPAAFGLLLIVFGVMAKDEKRRKMAMHIAVTVGLLGFLGTITGLLKLFTMLAGGEGARPTAVGAPSIMAILMLVYVPISPKSLTPTRPRRARALPPPLTSC